MFFIEGLIEPLKGLVKAYRTSTLQDTLNRTIDLKDVIPTTRFPPMLNSPVPFKNQVPTPMKSPLLNFRRDTFSSDRDELRRRKLCFTWKEPWVPRNKCAKRKEHYIEVFS